MAAGRSFPPDYESWHHFSQKEGGTKKDYFILGRRWGEVGGECMKATQTQLASKVQGAAPARSLPGLPGEHPTPDARLPLQPLALSFDPAHNDSDLWHCKSLL